MMPPSRTSTEDSVDSTSFRDDLHPPGEWEDINKSIDAELLAFQNNIPQIELETFKSERFGTARSNPELQQIWENIGRKKSALPADLSSYELKNERAPTDHTDLSGPGQQEQSGKWTEYQEPKSKRKASHTTARQRLRQNRRPRYRNKPSVHTDDTVAPPEHRGGLPERRRV